MGVVYNRYWGSVSLVLVIVMGTGVLFVCPHRRVWLPLYYSYNWSVPFYINMILPPWLLIDVRGSHDLSIDTCNVIHVPMTIYQMMHRSSIKEKPNDLSIVGLVVFW